MTERWIIFWLSSSKFALGALHVFLIILLSAFIYLNMGSISGAWARGSPQDDPRFAQCAPTKDDQKQLQQFRRDIHRRVNRARAEQLKQPLKLHRRLNIAAQRHAAEMARRRLMSHRGSNADDRAKRARYFFHRIGENVAIGQSSPREVFTDWMGS
jgi:uncharacterized protein YkwD